MTRKDYSEDLLIQQPTVELLERELQRESIFAYDTEKFGPDGLLGRHSDREVVLRREVDAALRRLNPGLPDEAYIEALTRVMSDDLTKTLVQMNEEKYRMLRDGVPVRYRDNEGRIHDQRLKLVDFGNPATSRNHQYLGVNRVIGRLLSEEPAVRTEVEAGRLGVFWHTQGSGKSYSMIFLTEKIHRKISAKYTFVIMTDRNELDDQIFGTYTACGAATNKKAKAGNGKGLEKLLKDNHRYVFSLIHKFHRLVDEAYSPRTDIIVISDEAHRTQYGRLALNMRKAIPQAKFLGFTGTPLIDHAEKQLTRGVFGEYVSIYDFQRAVADGATLPLFYENRGEKLQIIDEEINEWINERIETAREAGELDADQEEKLYRELARDYPILTSPTRLDKVADDFVQHYHQRWQTGKAMMVCLDKITCVRMYDRISKTWKATWEELDKKVAVEEATFAVLGRKPDKFKQLSRTQVEWMKETD